MSGWQPQEHDPGYQRPAAAAQWGQPVPPAVRQPAYAQQPQQQHRQVAQVARRAGLTAAGTFWYVLGCIPVGAMYFAKVPTAKALSELPRYRAN